MKIEIVENNVVLVNRSNENFEIHPLWLRERAKTENLVDKYNDQRLYDPSQLDQNIKIKKASMNNGHLNLEFTDGVKFEYEVNNLLYEIDKKEPLENVVLWDSSLIKKPKTVYEKDIFAFYWNKNKIFECVKKVGFIIEDYTNVQKWNVFHKKYCLLLETTFMKNVLQFLSLVVLLLP